MSDQAEQKQQQQPQDEGQPKHEYATDDNAQLSKAATMVQKHYRGHVVRRELAGMNLSSSARWNDALTRSKLQSSSKEAAENKNDAGSRWKRGGFYAGRLAEGGGGHPQDGATPEEGGKTPGEGEETGKKSFFKRKKSKGEIPGEAELNKQMEAQYWLEVVDQKHRYGTNLKWYHKYWNEEAQTDENFFYWLDHGGGKDLDLEKCPRERLEKEQITYLTADQRRNYRVEIDKEGKLVWARNGLPVDTQKGKHRDLGEGRGITNLDEDGNPLPGDDDDSSSDSSLSSSDDGASEEDGQHYGNGPHEVSKRKYYFSPRAVMDHLLRKTTKRNIWIYVADMDYNLYVGIKQTGTFQHSSFLYGSRVRSAGLIRVKDGKLQSLSPLSGHYRAGTSHFKAFIEALRKKGVNMDDIAISKSVFVISAIEKYGKVSKKKKNAKEKAHYDKEKLKAKVQGTTPPPADSDGKELSEDEKKGREIEASIRSGSRPTSSAPKPPPTSSAGSNPDGHAAGGENGEGEAGKKTSHLAAEGKKKEDMTDEERVQRGTELIQRAAERNAVKDIENLRGKEDQKQTTENREDETAKDSHAVS